jgi:hypothetical protein
MARTASKSALSSLSVATRKTAARDSFDATAWLSIVTGLSFSI